MGSNGELSASNKALVAFVFRSVGKRHACNKRDALPTFRVSYIMNEKFIWLEVCRSTMRKAKAKV